MSILNKSDDLLVSVIKVLLSYQLFIEHEGKGGCLNNKSFSKCINKSGSKEPLFKTNFMRPTLEQYAISFLNHRICGQLVASHVLQQSQDRLRSIRHLVRLQRQSGGNQLSSFFCNIVSKCFDVTSRSTTRDDNSISNIANRTNI